jgi:Protein kinase domain
MGEVYRAEDLKLGQPVALKFLPEGLGRDEQRLNRFLNEVRTAHQVTHSNVCRVYDVGEVDGQHYLSMEYVDGEDLASLLQRIGRLPKERAIQVASAAARRDRAGAGHGHRARRDPVAGVGDAAGRGRARRRPRLRGDGRAGGGRRAAAGAAEPRGRMTGVSLHVYADPMMRLP